MTAKVLIVDDDEMFGEMLRQTIQNMGYEASCAITLEEGLRRASTQETDVIFLDVRMPDGNGLDFLPRLRETPFYPEIIIITGLGDPDGAEMAIKSGAWDYIQKGSSVKNITLPLLRVLQYREEKRAAQTTMVLKREGIVGQSPKISACLDLMARAANSKAGVLITGETGTGKELFARAIHENSPRARNNFVVVDCAALPATLVESVLFGYEKGAYTGADQTHEGLILQADRGTLFLDEVGELSLNIQRAFLRVLQEQRFRPVGGKREKLSDFRLVAATNRNLDELAAQGEFRQDLLFRLKSFVIELPPLRECLDDLKDLALYHMARLCERNGIGIKGFSPEFLAALKSYNWPGNVRELVNTLDRALVAARDDPTLYPKHLPSNIRIFVARSSVTDRTAASGPRPSSPGPAKTLPTLQELRETTERQYMQDLMTAARGDVNQACRLSGLSRSRLYELMKKYGVSKVGGLS